MKKQFLPHSVQALKALTVMLCFLCTTSTFASNESFQDVCNVSIFHEQIGCDVTVCLDCLPCPNSEYNFVFAEGGFPAEIIINNGSNNCFTFQNQELGFIVGITAIPLGECPTATITQAIPVEPCNECCDDLSLSCEGKIWIFGQPPSDVPWETLPDCSATICPDEIYIFKIDIEGCPPPYTFEWSPEVIVIDDGKAVMATTAGPHEVTVYTSENCSATTEVTVNYLPEMELTCKVLVPGWKRGWVTQEDCSIAICPGTSVHLWVSSGNNFSNLSIYEYTWDGGTPIADKPWRIKAFSPGDYTVTVLNKVTGCKQNQTFTVTEKCCNTTMNTNLDLNIVVQYFEESCKFAATTNKAFTSICDEECCPNGIPYYRQNISTYLNGELVGTTYFDFDSERHEQLGSPYNSCSAPRLGGTILDMQPGSICELDFQLGDIISIELEFVYDNSECELAFDHLGVVYTAEIEIVQDMLDICCAYQNGEMVAADNGGIAQTNKIGQVSKRELIEENKISVMPNPFNDQVSFEINAQEESDFQMLLFDFNGRLVLSQEGTISQGLNLVELTDLGHLNGGVYYAKFKTNHFNKTLKLLK